MPLTVLVKRTCTQVQSCGHNHNYVLLTQESRHTLLAGAVWWPSPTSLLGPSPSGAGSGIAHPGISVMRSSVDLGGGVGGED